MNDGYVIETRNLTKIYVLGGEEVRALDGVNLNVAGGEFIAIFGASGSGKSTLLNMIGALDRPTSGEVILGGENIAKLPDRKLSRIRREKIGFIFQTFNLIPTLNATENVMAPRMPVEPNRRKLEEKAEALLRMVGLGDRMSHRPSELSGGQRQRVAIARALINEPSIILADEPTGNLDSKTGDEIISIMRSLNKEKGETFIIVSHNPQIASTVERVIHLRDGKIIKEETH
jgi:putative ABC transport system ATP-binding protein